MIKRLNLNVDNFRQITFKKKICVILRSAKIQTDNILTRFLFKKKYLLPTCTLLPTLIVLLLKLGIFWQGIRRLAN